MKKLYWKIRRILSKIFSKDKFDIDRPDVRDYDKDSVVAAILRAERLYPNHIALEYFNVQITYRELVSRIKNCAKALKKQGIKENDRVTICMPNTPEAIVALYAVNMIGAVASLIHPLSSENEIEFYLNKSKSKMIITLDMSYFRVKSILENTKVEKIVVASATKSMGNIVSFAYWILKGRKIKLEKGNVNIMTWTEFIKQGSSYTKEYYVDKKDTDLAFILYSGGTTGRPKGIMLSNLNINAQAIQGRYVADEVRPGNSFLTILPNFHAFGLGISIHLPLYNGMKVILVPTFNIKKLGGLFKKYRPTAFAGVPSLYDALTKVKLAPNDLNYLKVAVCGGDSISLESKKRINEYFKEHGSTAKLRVGYGLTESAGACCLSPIGMEEEAGLIGVPFVDNVFKIVVPGTTEEQEYGKDGEICIAGPNQMMGYLDDEEETSNVLVKHEDDLLWLHTGDMGYMDSNGLVYFKARIKRMYITSGFNVYPQHIEEVLDSHEAVYSSAVIGVSHPYKGEVGKAFVVLKEGIKPTLEIKNSIKTHLKKNLSYYAIPAEIKYVDDLPKTLIGKIAYKELK